MQRIWISGSSGSGKTTLANKLGDILNIPVYHRDNITWGKDWHERTEEEQIAMVKEISIKEKWIFEGNRFTASRLDGRLNNCDTVIHLDINRVKCLYRGVRRYFKHKNNTRPELSEGCTESYSMEIAKYVLYGYPKKKTNRQKLFNEATKLGKEVIILKGQRQVDEWFNSID